MATINGPYNEANRPTNLHIFTEQYGNTVRLMAQRDSGSRYILAVFEDGKETLLAGCISSSLGLPVDAAGYLKFTRNG